MAHSEMTVIGLTLTFALMASGPRQQPLQPSKQDGGYTLRQDTKLVVLDVVVTDKKGNLVPNLKKEDFEVQEDKQPQRIASFEAPGAHALPANVVIHSTEELDKLAPNAPATIIVLDEFSEAFADMAFAHYSIQQYLKPQPKLLSQPTMLLAVNIDHFVVLHDYTQDKDAILAALDHHVPDAAWRSGSTGVGANWWREQLISGFRSLEQVAQSTTGHPGHKNIIWVGHGFPHIRESSLSHDDSTMVKALLQKEINLLLAARVTLYSINPVGVTFGNEPFKNLVNIADVAKATGGKWFYNRNDVDAQIGTSARDGNEFYTLSYIPTSDSDEKGVFRNIHIMMKDPNLRYDASGLLSKSAARTKAVAMVQNRQI
jgi:VWFA-related protein